MPQHSFSRFPFAPRKGIALPRSKKRRSGISLLEVLFSMLLVTVGLFGAIALLPVAAQQAKRGRNADMQSVAGESAVAEFFVRDMNRTSTWIAPADTAYFKAIVNGPQRFDMMGMPLTDGMGNFVYEKRLIDYFPVVGYCIDPMFVDANRANAWTAPSPTAARYFPYYSPDTAATVSSDSNPAFSIRMERITLARSPDNSVASYQLNGQPGQSGVDDDNDGTTDMGDLDEVGWPLSDDYRYPMTAAHAQSIFYSEDDLYLDRVKDATVPASQVYSRLDDGSGTVVNMRRLTEGNFSWFATLAPRNVNNPDPATNDDYTLSIVMMYRRPYTTGGLNLTDNPPVSTSLLPCAERVTEVFWVTGGTGIGGGEILLRARPGREIGDLDVRPGDWIMLTGSYQSTAIYNPNWTNTTPPVPTDKRPIYQWYRVIDSDADVETRTSGMNTYFERRVSISGPDWPANLVTTEADFGTKQSVTQATIVTGVVSVYEKSVRLNFK